MQEPLAEELLIERFVELIRELGHYPVAGEVRMKSRSSADFPSHNTFSRFGTKSQFAARILDYCANRPELWAVASVCGPLAGAPRVAEELAPDVVEIGFVYLLKSGRFHKIGRSNAAGRRERELAIQLPEKAGMVHIIRPDDPAGIEGYWHRRFETKRMKIVGDLIAADLGDGSSTRRGFSARRPLAAPRCSLRLQTADSL